MDQRVIDLYDKDWIDRENPRMAWRVARNLALAATISEPERGSAVVIAFSPGRMIGMCMT